MTRSSEYSWRTQRPARAGARRLLHLACCCDARARRLEHLASPGSIEQVSAGERQTLREIATEYRHFAGDLCRWADTLGVGSAAEAIAPARVTEATIARAVAEVVHSDLPVETRRAVVSRYRLLVQRAAERRRRPSIAAQA